MASDIAQHHTLLDQLDARQDDLLGELDDLNQRIEALLREFACQTPRSRSGGTPVPEETSL